MSREVLGREEPGPASDAAAPTPGAVIPTSLDSVGRSWRGQAVTAGGAADRGRVPGAARLSSHHERRQDGDRRRSGKPPVDGADVEGTDVQGSDVQGSDVQGSGLREPDGDAAGTGAPEPWSRGVSGALSGRRALLLAAAGGALVGGLLATGMAERADLRAAQSTASIHAWVEPAAGTGSADSIGLTVRVVNTGDAPVTVVGAGMHGGLAQDGPVRVLLAEDVVVQPDGMASGQMDAQADCSGAPLAENSSTDGRLQLRVRTQDGREQLLTPPTGGISLTSADIQEAFCGQSGLRLGLSVAAIQVRPAGELSMSLLNDSPQPMTLDFSSPSGTRIVADKELPLVVEPSQRTGLIIGMEVQNCTNDAQRVQAGNDVQLIIDGRARRGGLDSTIVNAWVAREVALACS